MSHDEFVMQLILLGFTPSNTPHTPIVGDILGFEHSPTHSDIFSYFGREESDTITHGVFIPFTQSLPIIIQEIKEYEDGTA